MAISIHAPHARSDMTRLANNCGVDISIHAPHARSDQLWPQYNTGGKFQSTLLMRGATIVLIRIRYPDNFNPRSSCEERLRNAGIQVFAFHISIHAPHARSDSIRRYKDRGLAISIHAPHARSDTNGMLLTCAVYYFNPRSSCEERRRLF